MHSCYKRFRINVVHLSIKNTEFNVLWFQQNTGNNNKCFLISEGSCDTEDWSNDADNSALHHRNK